MPTLTIRNISEDGFARFRVRAAVRGRSMEAEARQMIENGESDESLRLSPEERLASARALFREAFGGKPPEGLVDDLLADRRAAAARGE